jgi:hypothetical protein
MMQHRAISRRSAIAVAAGLVAAAGSPALSAASGVSLPVRLPERAPGEGLVIRHGYCTENTWYNPGWWHTGEDWYTTDGDAGGVPVVSIAPGVVVFAGSEYPGRVVIIEHDSPAGALYSMYGHLDPALLVARGDRVDGGAVLGTILRRTDGRAPSHLHFEVRTFLTRTEINGADPRYGVGCGSECPPGPGYWPIDAPEHPSQLGWRNPTHVIASGELGGPDWTKAIANEAAEVAVWSLPSDRAGAEQTGTVSLSVGESLIIRRIAHGRPDSTGTSAGSYRFWLEVEHASGLGWVRAFEPSIEETGSDGRPSMLRLRLIPA